MLARHPTVNRRRTGDERQVAGNQREHARTGERHDARDEGERRCPPSGQRVCGVGEHRGVRVSVGAVPRVAERGCYDAAAAARRDGRHERMSQIDVATKSPIRQRTQGLRSRVEVFVRRFEWTWTNAVLFSMALLVFLFISSVVMPSFWMYYAEQKIGWAGPTDLQAFLQHPFGTSITNPLSLEGDRKSTRL